MSVKRWLSDNAVELASLSIAAVGGVSSFACGIGAAFEAYPAQMGLYTVALAFAGGIVGWVARSSRERSKCRLELLSPGEARAAYDLLVLGDPLEVGDHLDAVFMSIKGGRGVFECSTEGEMIPTAVYTLTPKWRAFLSRHVGDLRDLAEHDVTSS